MNSPLLEEEEFLPTLSAEDRKEHPVGSHLFFCLEREVSPDYFRRILAKIPLLPLPY